MQGVSGQQAELWREGPLSQPPPRLASCPTGHIPGCWLQQNLSAIPTSHTWPGADAACWGPFLLWGCSVSAAHFLQAGAELWPSLVPSGSEGGEKANSSGEFGEDGGRMVFLCSSCRQALVLHWGCCCCPSCRARPSPSLSGSRELSPRGPSFLNDTSPLCSAVVGQR